MPSFVFPVLLCAGLILCFSTPVAGFGAGNIVSVSQVEGKNWRHGDIEDTLLELFISVSAGTKFDKLAVKRVYFGNWLRDYSQAIDVGGLKQLPKETIRIMLWVLSFITFGFATGEFEVTEERLGCYRPEEHIDNPKDYADNEDARKYDSRLRGPVDEGKELAIDERSGLKTYIASEDRGIDTSAGLVRKKFITAIEKGRAYGRDGSNDDLYEALRLLGTGLHCLEDFSAHSNYVELALREMGVDVFPHVGQNTEVEVNGKRIWPLITGTFGMTDFLHSVVGEVSDKVVQSEAQSLDDKLAAAEQQSQSDNTTSTLKGILDNIPFGLLGLGDSDFGGQASKLQEGADAKQLEQTSISGNSHTQIAGMDVEQLKDQAAKTVKEIYPIMEFHDKVMKAIQQGIDKIPGASELLENLTGAMQIFVFSILAPYVKPILLRVKTELAAGSGGVLQASENAQFNVFEDGNSSDPTHSVLSKDHFTNVLNAVAGRVASEAVRFATPLIVSAWEDTNKDPNQICDEILQTFHHPALRDEGKQGQRAMFEAVRNWWDEKNDDAKERLKQALSKDGIREGKNHEGDDPNPGPGGCGHSHGAVRRTASSSQNQGRSIGSRDQEESPYRSGGGYSAPSRARQEETSSDGSSGGYDSSNRYRQEATSYEGRREYDSPSREDTASYSGSGGGYRSSDTHDGGSRNDSYGSSTYRRNNDEDKTSHGRNTEDLSGSSARHWGGEDTNTSYSAERASTREHSSYSSRNEDNSSSYRRGGEDDTPSYGQETPSYGRDNQASYGASTRNFGGDSYGSSAHRNCNDEEETPSYGRSRDTETSPHDRDRDNEISSYRHGGDNETSSYGREAPSHSRDDQESSSYERQPSSYSHGGGNDSSSYNRDEDTSSYGRRRGEDNGGEEAGSYGRHRGEEEESSGYGGGYGGSGY